MGVETKAMSDEELREQLTTWAGRVAAGEAVVLQLLAELDERGAWAQDRVLSCAHWATWRLGWSLTTSRERVRVARKLRSLPLTASTFAAGRLSYAQVRAITRVATAESEHTWVELARHSTAAQRDRAAAGVAQSLANEQREHDPEAAAWKNRARTRWEDDGTLVVTFRIAPEDAPAVMAALEQARAAEQSDRDAAVAEVAAQVVGGASAEDPGTPAEESADTPTEAPEPYDYVEPPYPDPDLVRTDPERGNRLVDEYWAKHRRRQAKAQAWREHQEQLQRRVAAAAAAQHVPTTRADLGDALVRLLTKPAGGKPVKVQLLVDPLSGWGRTRDDQLLPPSTLAALLRRHPAQGRRRAIKTDGCDLGRSTRVVSPRLRDLLGLLDGERCRIPCCTRTRNLHAHHVVFWSQGGRTDLANLVLACSRHHTLIHRDGYRLELGSDRRLRVWTAAGTELLHHPALPHAPAEDLDPDRLVTAATLPTDWSGERMDLGYAVNVMMQHAA